MKVKTTTIGYLLTILISINIISCKSNSAQTKNTILLKTTKSSKSAVVKKFASGSNCDSIIVNYEFSYDAMEFEVFKADTDKIKSLFLDSVVLKMEKQTKDEGGEAGAYDLYNFTDGINKIVLLKNNGFYIEDADIKNDKVRLNRKIEIGMNEDIFLNLLKVKSIRCDTVTVADDEISFESVYIFKGAKLKEIEMGQIVE